MKIPHKTPSSNPLSFKPLVGREYDKVASQLTKADLKAFDDWQLEQINRRLIARLRDNEITLMIQALGKTEPPGQRISRALLALCGMQGRSRAIDGLEELSRALDATLKHDEQVSYCLECMNLECECEATEDDKMEEER